MASTNSASASQTINSTISATSSISMGYVDGTLPCPPCFKTNEAGQLTDEVNPAYRTWIAQDQMVLGWIHNSVTPAVLATVARSTNSFYTWSTNTIRPSVYNFLQQARLSGFVSSTLHLVR
ncbi:hypothetical protein ACLB2K_035995 [Fragaria x ananassa]